MEPTQDSRIELDHPIFSVLRILGMVIGLFSLTLLLPWSFAAINDEPLALVYGETMLISAVVGALLTGLTWWHRRELYPREGFLLVALVWLTLPVVAAIPRARPAARDEPAPRAHSPARWARRAKARMGS